MEFIMDTGENVFYFLNTVLFGNEDGEMMLMYIHRWKKMHFCLDENLTCQVQQQPLFHFPKGNFTYTHTYTEKKMIIKLGSKFIKFKRLVLTATARWKTM